MNNTRGYKWRGRHGNFSRVTAKKKKGNERGLFRRQRLTELLHDVPMQSFSLSTNFHAVGGFKKAQLILVYQRGDRTYGCVHHSH
jgi:hypothetical protein